MAEEINRLKPPPKDKRYDAAWAYYVHHGYELKQIAEALTIAPNTLTRWKNGWDWDEDRDAYTQQPQLLTKEVRRLQRELMELSRVDLTTLTKEEMGQHEMKVLMTNKIADSISKTNAAIKSIAGKLTGSDYIQALIEFGQYVKRQNKKDAELLVGYGHQFILTKTQ